MNGRTLLLALTALVLLHATSSAAPPKKLLLIGGGPDGHPPQTHEFMAGLKVLARCLQEVPDLEVTTVRADGAWKEGPELIDRADGVVVFLGEGARWMQQDEPRYDAFARLAARGGGIVVLHWGIGTKEARYIDRFVKLVGGCHGGPDRKYKELETDVEPADARHPILAGVGKFRVKDEFYYQLKFVQPEGTAHPILHATIDGRPETVAWTWERPDGGRSFGFSGLHFHANWRLPEYRRLVAQAVLWTLKLDVPKKGLAVEFADALAPGS